MQGEKPARFRAHDEIAVPMVLRAWEKHDFTQYPWGLEVDAPALREALSSQHDRTSIMLRFRPDRVLVNIGIRSVLCEIKSDTSDGHWNFAVEFDSYTAAIMWNASHGHVCYAFVDIARETISACWANDIARPSKIMVPNRWDHEATIARIRRELPDAEIRVVAYSAIQGGSGTAFFLLSKRNKVLLPIDTFIRARVLQQPVPPTSPATNRGYGTAPGAVSLDFGAVSPGFEQVRAAFNGGYFPCDENGMPIGFVQHSTDATSRQNE